jgi:predicted transcriptional regulator
MPTLFTEGNDMPKITQVSAPLRANWPATVKRIRRKLKVSDAEIARLCRISKGTLSEIASGQVPDPRYSTCVALLTLEQQP